MSDTLNDVWADRRVNIGYETAEELAKHYNLLNWRGHPEAQRDATEESLDALGYVGAIKKSIKSGVILDGHLRIEIALAKDPSIQLPVDYYDLSPDEEALALQVLDATTEMAEPIPDKLAALLARTREMTADRPGLGAMLQRLKERAGINGHQKTEEDGPPPIDKAAELQKVWGVKVGDVWELGQHRLVCGDCTDRAVVEAVMRGERAEACITDPPYGMNWNADASRFSGGKFGNHPRGRERENVINDDKPFDPTPFLGFPVVVLWGMNHFCDKLPPGGVLVWIKKPDDRFGTFLSDCELGWTNTGYGVYAFRHEWGGITRESERGEFLHPTQKPVALIAWAIEKSKAGQVIYDPFTGSGTTIIASENLGRKCRAIELDPGYAAVSLQRFFDLSGLTPKRIS